MKINITHSTPPMDIIMLFVGSKHKNEVRDLKSKINLLQTELSDYKLKYKNLMVTSKLTNQSLIKRLLSFLF